MHLWLFRKSTFWWRAARSEYFPPSFGLLKRNIVNRNVHMQWQRKRDDAKNHIAIQHILQHGGGGATLHEMREKSPGYHRRYVCMGKTIFMGTIKPNCFNLIGNFSSFYSDYLFFSVHLIDKQREQGWGMSHWVRDFTCFDKCFIHNWYMTERQENYVGKGRGGNCVECILN